VAKCRRMFLLTLGYEYVPRWISVEDGGDEVMREPVTAALVDSPDGWFLLETGLTGLLRDDPRLLKDVYIWGPQPELAGEGDPLLSALAQCSTKVAEIAGVAVSHFHVDHTGGLRHFANGPPVFVQREELEFGMSETGFAERSYWTPGYNVDGLRWQTIDGDAQLAAGVLAVSTKGHTPGHMSYLVDLESGPWLLAVDAIDLQENLNLDQTVGQSIRKADTPLRRVAHDHLVALADELGARLVPGHCPATWPQFPAPPAFVC
jgi:N-acyl homoserine lactone hydrolase